MKRNIYFCALCAIALSGILVASCDKNEPETVELAELTLSENITASAEGGTFSFSYSVTNTTSDGTLTCEAGVSWISGIDCSVPGTVSFTVAENTESSIRGGDIIVTYTYANTFVVKKFSVVQNGNTFPELSVQPVGVTAGFRGGTYSFTYMVTNPADDGKIFCETEDSWIKNLDYSEDGIVTFDVSFNSDEDIRSGEITVTYTYSRATMSKTVGVVQDHYGDTGVFTGDLFELVGTYEASAIAYDSENEEFTEQTWTLTIYDKDATTLIIDGITPQVAGFYPDASYYICTASFNDYGQLVIPTQLTGYKVSSTGYLIGFTPCVGYDGTTCSIDLNGPDCTFVYNSDGTWTSDYGMVLALFEYRLLWDSFEGAIDIVATSITITKVSDSTSTSALSVGNGRLSALDAGDCVIHPLNENIIPRDKIRIVDSSKE